MRIGEKMGLVYTALFLTVSVAVITQNSGRLMAAFRGESSAQAVDDIFTVQTGQDQPLLVLRNDVAAKTVSPAQIHLTQGPKCGAVRQINGGFVYGESASCTGHQSFTYCLDTGRSCKPAIVALRLIAPREPIDSILNGPITDLSGFQAQTDINGRDLEITNVHLGNSFSGDKTSGFTPTSKLAKTAIAMTPEFVRPTPLFPVHVDGTFDMPAKIDAQQNPTSQARPIREAAAEPTILTDATEAQPSDIIALPIDPATKTATRWPAINGATFSLRAAGLDTGFRAPTVMPGIDNSPFGIACKTRLNATAIPGAIVRLSLTAPCFPNSEVQIFHGKLRVTLMTDHIGNLRANIPAFESKARFLVRLADATRLTATVPVPDLENFDRVAIQWTGRYNATLLALTATGKTHLPHLRADQPGEVAHALRTGTGFMVRLGDLAAKTPRFAEIYSLPKTGPTGQKVIGFAVRASATATTCGQGEIIQTFRSKGGRLVGASGLQFKLPDCGQKNQSVVLDNVVRDLIIAKN